MFGLFKNKKRHKEKIDALIIEKMKDFSDETEKTYRSFISYIKEDFPSEKIDVSNYGIYKARFGTNLMIAIGAQFSKAKIGYGNGSEFFDDIQIASAIAYQPFSNQNSSNYIEKSSITKQTEEIIKYIVEAIKPYQDELYSLNINKSEKYFIKLKIYFHSCISESIVSKEIISKIIEQEEPFFDNITNQNLNILTDFMRITTVHY